MGNPGGYMPTSSMHSPSAHGGASQKVGKNSFLPYFKRNPLPILYFDQQSPHFFREL